MRTYRTFVDRSILVAALAVVFCAPALPTDLTWDWSYSSNQFSGMGTLTTNPTVTTGIGGFMGYRIVDISGVFGTGVIPDLITGLLPPGGFQSNDNLLGPSQPQLDSIGGLSFSTNGTLGAVNIDYPGSPLYEARNSQITDNGAGAFTARIETPEPATAVLMAPTLLAFALFVRRRNIKARPRS
ncbi:MAG: hypothetical protein WBW33_15665 [Bryobacteraceae bacterium]